MSQSRARSPGVPCAWSGAERGARLAPCIAAARALDCVPVLAGHYTTAFLAKAASPRAPLWVLLVAAQFVDVLWGLFVLAGVEHARLDSSLASNPLVLFDMPWTHSLAGSLAWSALAFVACRALLGLDRATSVLAASVVLSHWFLDLVVHRPDLTIAGGEARMGLALWDLPATAYLLEVALVAWSAWLAMRACTRTSSGRRAWVGLAAGLLALQTIVTAGPVPPSITAVVLTGLVVYLFVAAAGARVDAATAA